MKTLSQQHKESIQNEFNRFQPLINRYAKEKPTISYNYFDGWYMSAFWRNEKASVEFCCYQTGSELNAYKDDDSEWLEIDEGRRCSCIERNGNRKKLPDIITESRIKQVFAWLYEES